MKKLYLNVMSNVEHWDAPMYVEVMLTPELLDRIEELQAVVGKHKACDIRDDTYYSTLRWQGGEDFVVDEELLVVSADDFYFYTDDFQTDLVQVPKLRELMALATDGRVFWGIDEADVLENPLEEEA